MVEEVIKRNGEIEAWNPAKINGWGQWSSNKLKDRVDWSTIVIRAVQGLPKRVHSQELMRALIQACLEENSWSGYLMAGRLMVVYQRKEMYGSFNPPTVKEMHDRLYELDLMIKLDYSDEDYAEIEKFIQHERDLNQPHFVHQYVVNKYSIQNRVTGKRYETIQFVFMRMAMTIYEKVDRNERLKLVKEIYDHFSCNRLSAPTPNYVNMGTKHKGFASCCLIAAGDSGESLAVADYIANKMTQNSAGIGTSMITRTVGDPVRAGQFRHEGKLPYYSVHGKSVRANTQAGRGGALNMYYNFSDPEAMTITHLRNPKSIDSKRNRDMNYTVMFNSHMARAAAKKEKLFNWTLFNAPDLHDAFYSNDRERYEAVYNRYLNDDNFEKNFFDARELLREALIQAYEVGTLHEANIEEINRHTPFNEPIYSSNLCVAPETLVLTDKGHIPIIDLAGTKVNVWNGIEWSAVDVVKTGENQKLIAVTTMSRRNIDCTPYHKFYIKTPEGIKEVEAKDLKCGDQLIDWIHPTTNRPVVGDIVLQVEDLGRTDDTYCFTEPKRHMGVFNGLLTGQCVEITQPTKPYYDMRHLFASAEIGDMSFIGMNVDAQTNENYRTESSTKFTVERKGRTIVISANDLLVGDLIIGGTGEPHVIKVIEITGKTEQPEISTCSLAAIVVSSIDDTKTYENVAYHALRMIDFCIDNGNYPFPHLAFTAKQRRNAAVGMMAVAEHMAKNQLSYKTLAGREELHFLAERHMYCLIKASLKIASERGVAPWINRTKWVDGWTPLDTYNRNVDCLFENGVNYFFNWTKLKEEIRTMGGLAHSALCGHMPSESSSKGMGKPNSLYPIRRKVQAKTDQSQMIYWAAPESDNPDYHYEIAWDIGAEHLTNLYAITQKFSDHSISADYFRRLAKDEKVPANELFRDFFYRVKMGVKTRYYQNSATSSEIGLDVVETAFETGCAGGACSL